VKLKNKVSIVTGAASGIGKATAKKFSEEGSKVVLADLDEKGGQQAVDEIKSSGGDAIFVKTNVADPDSVKSLMDKAVEEYGKIDILHNNAGMWLGSDELKDTVTEIPLHLWDKMIAVNLTGVFLCSRFAIPHMIKNGGGSIINTSSVGGLIGGAGVAAYQASKGGVVQLTKQMAVEYGKDNVRVNCICPSAVDTPMCNEEEREDGFKAGVIERIADPSEIAHAVTFLAQDESGYITGTILTVDAGFVNTRK